jgi:hypothetical protein
MFTEYTLAKCRLGKLPCLSISSCSTLLSSFFLHHSASIERDTYPIDMGAQEPTPENYTLLQGFEWNAPADGKHYQRLHHAMPAYKQIGISNIWLPPGCKASSPNVRRSLGVDHHRNSG